MKESSFPIVTFLIDDLRFAFPLSSIGSVIRAVAIRKVPDINELIEGVFDFHGTIIPLINLRKRFGLPERSLAVQDRIIIVDTEQGKMAVSVDQVEFVRFIKNDDLVVIPSGKVVHAKEKPEDSKLQEPILLRDKDGIVIIYHLVQLITMDIILELDKLFHKENTISP